MPGWIKLHRSLIDWEWYTDHNTSRLFIHCLLRANFEDHEWRGISIKRGSFYTSLNTLSAETGLSLRKIRTSFDKLVSTGELTSSGMARGRMITVLEYDSYQEDDRLNVSLMTGKRQGSDRVVTTNKNDKKKKNDKKEILIPIGINELSWSEWTTYRKAKKKPVSKIAADKQFKLLLNYDLDQQSVIINQSIQNDYQGLFEPKINGYTNQPSQEFTPISDDEYKELEDALSQRN